MNTEILEVHVDDSVVVRSTIVQSIGHGSTVPVQKGGNNENMNDHVERLRKGSSLLGSPPQIPFESEATMVHRVTIIVKTSIAREQRDPRRVVRKRLNVDRVRGGVTVNTEGFEGGDEVGEFLSCLAFEGSNTALQSASIAARLEGPACARYSARSRARIAASVGHDI